MGLSQIGSPHHQFLHSPQYISPLPTCEGDLGLAGAGDAGASVWLGLAVGLGMGEASSGGDGVFAMRRGPESLDEHTRVSDEQSRERHWLSRVLHLRGILRTSGSACHGAPF